jgi:alpha-N-arabinofuranosidase
MTHLSASRRQWLQRIGSAAVAADLGARAASDNDATLLVDPTPLFPISPRLYMQFMEPLGVTDSSVEAAWDYATDDWREDFVGAVRQLSPGAIRFGGNFSRYYKWREGVGPSSNRPWMRNYDWGGKETNRVGTHEFVSFCRRVSAEPFYCVNFEGDGIQAFKHTPEGDRTGDAQEAADWVSYTNDPDNKERKAHGFPDPYNLKLWQVGNETSYVREAFPKEHAIARTIEFAKAMRARDPNIQIIGWGDKGRGDKKLWAGDLLRQAGEHINYVAIHMMGQSPTRLDTALSGPRYQSNPHRAWQELLELSNKIETRIQELEDTIAEQRSPVGIAVTEGHLSLKPHNANPILFEWVSAVYHARSFNIYQRHGGRVKIATAADFNGTRWTVMAVHTPVPRGKTFLLPVASIARLFRAHNGEQGIQVRHTPPNLDVAASRTGDTVFLHVLNLDSRNSVEASFGVQGRRIATGRVHEIAPDDLRASVDQDRPDTFEPVEKTISSPGTLRWRFPAASVSAVELKLAREL